MHAVAHTLGHRAPPATRTRVRWQPYLSNNASSSTSRSPSISSLHTPQSIPSSPPSTPLPSHPQNEQHQTSHTQPSQTSKESSRETSKKHALVLVDQAVNSLWEIWRPQDIPSVFSIPTRSMSTGALIASSADSSSNSLTEKLKRWSSDQNHQLPSPVSPPARNPPSPTCKPLNPPPREAEKAPALVDAKNSFIPLKGFVHEVLRRSRTSGAVLQTALCYLEAVRTKVPEILRQEAAGERGPSDAQLESQIVPATPEEIEEQLRADTESGFTTPYHIEAPKTVRSLENLDHDFPTHEAPTHCQWISTPDLPSPLLCPRRTFLAALILASKFTQDKCYSNRAWAKLSGLAPKEIGRCERALGEALEWRLWVGKAALSNSGTMAVVPPVTRPVARSQSEGSLRDHPSQSRTPFLVDMDKPLHQSHIPPSRAGLRKCATMPAAAFALKGLSEHHISPMALTTSENTSMSDDNIDLYSAPPRAHPHSSPPTPALTSSPSSTESSSGDQTIQMSTFFEDAMTPSGIINGEAWALGSDVTFHCKPPMQNTNDSCIAVQIGDPALSSEYSKYVPSYGGVLEGGLVLPTMCYSQAC